MAKSSGIGNVLCPGYDHVAPDVLWKLAQDDLAEIEKVCREELVGAASPPPKVALISPLMRSVRSNFGGLREHHCSAPRVDFELPIVSPVPANA